MWILPKRLIKMEETLLKKNENEWKYAISHKSLISLAIRLESNVQVTARGMGLETLSPYDNMILAQICPVQFLLLLSSHQIFINSPGWQSLFSPDNLMRRYRIEFIMLFFSLHKRIHSETSLEKKKAITFVKAYCMPHKRLCFLSVFFLWCLSKYYK